MSVLDDSPSDAELVARVRAGDTDAYGHLWSRHVEVARGLARRISSRDHEDLIGESYTRVLSAIRSGRGPDTAFRPYLMSTIRRVNIDNARRYHSRVVPTDSASVLDQSNGESSEDVVVRQSDGASALAAWESLPEDTRDLLWRLVVLDESPSRVSGTMGLTPNAVATRAKRARERLRQAYLSHLVGAAAPPECRLVRTDLGAFVRGGLSETRREIVAEHLESCARCTDAVADLRSVDGMIRLRVVPLLPLVAIGAASTIGQGAGMATQAKGTLATLKAHAAGASGVKGPLGLLSATAGLAAAVTVSAVLMSGHGQASLETLVTPPPASAPTGGPPRPATAQTAPAMGQPTSAAVPSGRPTPPGIRLKPAALSPTDQGPASVAPGPAAQRAGRVLRPSLATDPPGPRPPGPEPTTPTPSNGAHPHEQDHPESDGDGQHHESPGEADDRHGDQGQDGPAHGDQDQRDQGQGDRGQDGPEQGDQDQRDRGQDGPAHGDQDQRDQAGDVAPAGRQHGATAHPDATGPGASAGHAAYVGMP